MSAFTDAVADGLVGLTHVSVVSEESHFSWAPCDVCGSMLGGDREIAQAVVEGTANHIIELSICTDCTMYLANGDEPEDWRIK